MKDGFFHVAAVSPALRVADCAYNAQQIIAAMRDHAGKDVQLLVFPELCITGYTCGDLFLQKTLRDLYEAVGERRVTICRELTKKHETVFASTLSESLSFYEQNEPRGECVIVMEGRSRRELRREEQKKWEELSVQEHVGHYEALGMDRKEAMKQAAKDRGVSKREIYAQLLRP